MELGIKNKSVLITAASKGIGKAIAECFLSEGCKVIISSGNKDNLNKTANELSVKYKTKVEWMKCDLNNFEELKELHAFVQTKFDGPDILVNNCGGPIAGYFDVLDESNWEYAYNQVLMSAVRLIKLSVPRMKEKKWGRIINITSLTVKQPIDHLLLSNTFRAGLTAVSKSLSNQLAKFNITVNNLAPGYTLTDRVDHLIKIKAEETKSSIDDVMLSFTKDIPAQRMANPMEIGSVAVFLASEKASYINGTTIQVDGGSIKGLL
ncbi:MAG TPA: SDR family oxidoreductase [Ignavibacteriaceae bacterium]|mgnify:CR=1 FL=1|nr:SDR family oxidoreductase [Ignavibacteriaceae bacterium]